MSHFFVLVIGDNIEDQLQPFHEFECTGIDDRFVQDLDITDEAKKDFEKSTEYESFSKFCEDYYGNKQVAFGQSPDLSSGPHKYGYTKLGESGEVVAVVRRTNPNKKWDYWTIGGRYDGRLKTKSGLLCNSETAGQIDWVKMSDEARARAEAAWGKYEAGKVGGIHAYLDHDIQKDDTKESYLERRGRFSCFAILKDGQWFERGSMGWWACVSGEKKVSDWNGEIDKLLLSLPPETLVTAVDCHI